MQIDVLLPTGTRTVDLEELKELVRQGVVQPSTLLETGGQRGKAKNVPALKPIFAELAAAPTQAPEPPSFPPIPTPPESPRTVESPNVPSPPSTPEPPVFPSIPEEPRPLVFPQIATSEPPRSLDFSQLEQPSPEEVALFPPIETPTAATPPEPPRFPEVSTSDASPQFPPVAEPPKFKAFASSFASVSSNRGSSLALQMSARRKTKLVARLKKTGRNGRRWAFALDVIMILGTLAILAIPFLGIFYVVPYFVSCAVLSCFWRAFFTAIELYAINCEEADFPALASSQSQSDR